MNADKEDSLMGTWQATILATGTHDYFKTGDETSAEQIIKKAVEELKEKGHNVHFAAVGPVNHQIRWDGLGTGPSLIQGAFMAEKPASDPLLTPSQPFPAQPPPGNTGAAPDGTYPTAPE